MRNPSRPTNADTAARMKAAGEGVEMKVAGNQSALVRALVEAYLGREGA